MILLQSKIIYKKKHFFYFHTIQISYYRQRLPFVMIIFIFIDTIWVLQYHKTKASFNNNWTKDKTNSRNRSCRRLNNLHFTKIQIHTRKKLLKYYKKLCQTQKAFHMSWIWWWCWYFLDNLIMELCNIDMRDTN